MCYFNEFACQYKKYYYYYLRNKEEQSMYKLIFLNKIPYLINNIITDKFKKLILENKMSDTLGGIISIENKYVREKFIV